MDLITASSHLNMIKRRKLLHTGGAFWLLYLRNKQRRTRSVWTKDWLLRREDFGAYDVLLSELRQEDQASFLNFLRVSPGIFDELLMKVTPLIEKEDTNFRKSISAGMRLAITLRYLATGESFKSLRFLFRVSNNTIGLIIPDTCVAIHDVLHEEYFKCPSTTEEWRKIADEYMEHWQFPNCIGALDSKHVSIRKPTCSGAMFFNYKHSFSVVLLAMVDAHYKFVFVDIGAQGRCSDAGVFGESHLNEALLNNTLSIPPPEPLPGTSEPFPFVIVADDAFPLREHLLKPYSHRNLLARERIFNYRICRARRCVENAFGIMACRFCCLLNPMCLCPSKVDKIILACCTMHHMLRTMVPMKYVARQEDPTLRMDQLPSARVSSRKSVTKTGKQYREMLCDYFNGPLGAVAWQDSML